MPRTGGEETRKRILATAERLFAERGFDATSVDRIARAAKVNKALIYYHFKDKNDLVLSLFGSILEELTAHLGGGGSDGATPAEPAPLREKVRAEIAYLTSRKKILTLMLMEALKDQDRTPFLFQCAEMVMEHERRASGAPAGNRAPSRDTQRYDLHEFFTGFLPVMLFVALGDKWCAYFGCDAEHVLDDFIEVFERSHLATHLTPGARE